MIKRLYNKSGEELNILGRQVPNDEYYDIPFNRWLELADRIINQTGIYNYIYSGDIVVNNGTKNLTRDEAISLCKSLDGIEIYKGDDLILENLRKVHFNGNVKITRIENDAYVEFSSPSNIGMVIPLTFVINGSGQQKFMDSQACNINSDYTFQVIPYNCELVGISYSNKNEGSDINLEVWKSDRNNGPNENLFYTWELRNARIGYKTNITNKQFNAGDKVAIYLTDYGKNPNDIVVTLYLKVLNDNNKEEFIEDFEGHF